MRIDILTLFPEMFASPFDASIIKRASDSGLVYIKIHNIRDCTHDRHHTVDDYTYGGGAGMVMKPEPLFEISEKVIAEIKIEQNESCDSPIILLSPQGRLFNQDIARELSVHQNLIFICGHYEGFDERVRQHLVSDEVSIGDYVLTGGEVAAMVVTDAVVRLLPGVLGSQESASDDSHCNGLLEYPQYTRPEEFRGWKVPEVLLSGNHAAIARWRRQQSLLRTLKRRPDLLSQIKLNDEDKIFLEDNTEEK